MIKINVENKGNCITKIVISGHAHYDEYGKDIVCAAVSSTVITTVNHILSLDKTIEHIEEDGRLIIAVIKDDDNTQKMLLSMLTMLSELEKDYPKHLKINWGGVSYVKV